MHQRSNGTYTIVLLLTAAAAAEDEIKRTPSGRPDLAGSYDAATLTPLQRPEKYGDNLSLTREEAEKIEADAAKRRADRHQVSDPDREPPPVGGDGSGGGAGNVGEYIWRNRPELVYEYACHEGNYAMGNTLRGARILESDVLAAEAGSTGGGSGD